MRKSEIFNLTWGEVDLTEGFIWVQTVDAKTWDQRSAPLPRDSPEMFKPMPGGLLAVPGKKTH